MLNMGAFNAQPIRLAWYGELPDMCRLERSSCAVRFNSNDANGCKHCFKVITRIEHTSPSADELCRFLEAPFILRHPKLLSPPHSIRPLTTSGSGKFRSCLDLLALVTAFRIFPLQVAKRSLPKFDLNPVRRSIQSSFCRVKGD